MRCRNFLNIAWIFGILCCFATSIDSLDYAGYKNWYASLKANYEKSLDQFRALKIGKADVQTFDQRLNRTLEFTRAIQTFEDVFKPKMQEIRVYYENLLTCAEGDKICTGFGLNKEVDRIRDPRFRQGGSNMTDSLDVIINQYVELIEKFSKLINETTLLEDFCYPTESVHTLITNAITDMALTIRKGASYLFTLLSYFNNKFNGGVSQEDLRKFDDGRLKSWNDLNVEFGKVTKNLSRQIYNCLPVENDTVSLKVFNEFLINDKDLEPSEFCKGKANCDVKVVKKECQNDSQKCTEIQPQCWGTVTNCRRLNKNPKLWLTRIFSAEPKIKICADKEFNEHWSLEAFAYKEQSYGNMSCLAARTKELNSYTNDAFISWFGDNHYMNLCTCTRTGQQGNNVSLHEAVSDVEKNFVVTGVRFFYDNHVLRLQIKEGKLGKNGAIQENKRNSVEWKSAENTKEVTDLQYFSFDHENRSIELVEYQVNESQVLTGVRFIKATNNSKTHYLKLDARFTPFNADGLLDPKQSYWMSEKNTPMTTTPVPSTTTTTSSPSSSTTTTTTTKSSISSKAAAATTKAPATSTTSAPPKPEESKFVNFVVSGLKKDVGQSSTPRFDKRPLEPQPEVALSGIEMYWDKIIDLENGVLKLRLTSYDNSRHHLKDLAALDKAEQESLTTMYS